MTNLRIILKEFLTTKCPRVYFQDVDPNTSYPYIVFDFPNIFDDGEGYQVITVDIDGWDRSFDAIPIETLMESINKYLNKRTLATDDFVVTFYLDNKLPLTDDDKRIKRRKYIYQARLFERS